MSNYDYDVGSNSITPVLMKTVLAGVGSAVINYSTGRIKGKIDVPLINKKVNYGLVSGANFMLSSLVGELITTYTFPSVSNGNRLASQTGASLLESVICGGSNLLLNSFLIPSALVKDVSSLELFVEGALIPPIADYTYSRYVSPAFGL